MTLEADIQFYPDFKRAVDYICGIDTYSATPLETLNSGLGIPVMVKNESGRMGLGSFKALGGPYAAAQLILQKWQMEKGEELPPHRLHDPDVRAFNAEQTFVTASAGNHGVGVAAGAQALGAKAIIVLSKAVPDIFEARLATFGAKVIRAGHDYETSVEAATKEAGLRNAILLSDGSWPGYTYIPKLVMEGYTVMSEELRQNFESSNQWPTHVFLQAGVGGLAAAITWMIRHNWRKQPEIIIVEPSSAACLKESHRAGKMVTVTGASSDMGRLDCKVASLVAWHVLEASDVTYLTITDASSIDAAKILSNFGFPTTSSGAASYAGVLKHLDNTSLDKTFRPLIFIFNFYNGERINNDNRISLLSPLAEVAMMPREE